MQQNTPQKQIKVGKKIFLVQYSIASKQLVHAIVTENDIIKSATLQQNTREVMIQDCCHQQKATVILMLDNETFMEYTFKKLKNTLLDKIFTGENYGNLYGRKHDWILLQYNCTPHKTIYTIRNQSDTFWSGNSLFKDVMAYFREGEMVYQGIIIHKSPNIEDVIKKMNLVKEFSMKLLASVNNNTRE